MEVFKLDNYKKEKGELFPKIEVLNFESQNKIFESLKNLISLSFDKDELFVELADKLASKDYDEDLTYNIHFIFDEFDFSKEEDVILIWDIKNIDKISSKVLLDNWDYIWYGDSDEAVILYQENNRKLLLITHYGRIFYNSTRPDSADL